MRPLIAAATATLLAQLAPAAGAAVAAAPAPAPAPAAGWVTGTVVDRHGAPVAGALVNALDTAEVPERGVLPDDLQRNALTDAAGHFRVQQPPTGYLLQVCVPQPVVGPGHRPVDERRSEDRTCEETVTGAAYAITYAGPDGVTDSWLTQHRLSPATTTTVDAGIIAVKPVGQVHGTITGAAHQTIAIMRLNDTTAYRIGADGRGAYRFQGMVPGRYYLAAGGDGTLPWRSRTFAITAYGDATVDGALRPGGTIVGRLLEGSRPARSDSVVVLRRGRPVAAVATDTTGRYRVAGLTRGSYRVGIAFPDGTYLPRTTPVTVGASGSVTTARPVDLTRGATLTVTFAGTGDQGRRELVDELRDSHGVPVRTRGSDGQGHAVYEDLAPGTYHVLGAFRRVYGRATVVVGRAARCGDRDGQDRPADPVPARGDRTGRGGGGDLGRLLSTGR